MASKFDMSSGKIEPENSGVTRVRDYLDTPAIGLALQEVREMPEAVTRDDRSQQHIRELLKKL